MQTCRGKAAHDLRGVDEEVAARDPTAATPMDCGAGEEEVVEDALMRRSVNRPAEPLARVCRAVAAANGSEAARQTRARVQAGEAQAYLRAGRRRSTGVPGGGEARVAGGGGKGHG